METTEIASTDDIPEKRWGNRAHESMNCSDPADYKHVLLETAGVRSVGPVVNMHDVCPQRYCQPISAESASQPTPIDTQARNLWHHAQICEDKRYAKLLREAAERIEEQRATIDDLRKPAVCQPERE